MAKHNRPSFGRSKAKRGLDLNDTPEIAIAPLFAHEPLVANARIVCEPFCGTGNLVLPMRARGIKVYASDILDRGCPDFFGARFPRDVGASARMQHSDLQLRL
jgi:hypothetical protein